MVDGERGRREANGPENGKHADRGQRVTVWQRSKLGALVRGARDVLARRSPFQGWSGLRLAIGRTAAWPFRYQRWRTRCRRGEPLARSAAPPVTVILTSFSRPQNIAAQVDAALACGFVEEIVALNHNPAVDLSHYLRRRDPRLRLVQRAEPTGCGKRIEFARELGRAHYISIDDDLYLWPEQIAALARCLAAEPDRLHGIAGQTFPDAVGVESGSWRNENRTVEVINRVYAFTGAHAVRFCELIEFMQHEFAGEVNMNTVDDIILSYAGAAWPRIHDLGPYIPDPTSMDRGAALHIRDGFEARRRQVVAWCRRTREPAGTVAE